MAARPARLLFLNSRSEYGGADMGLLSVVRHLSPERFASWVILPQEGPLVADLRQAGASVHFMPLARLERLDSLAEVLRFPWQTIRSTWLLQRFIRRQGIDLVYTNSSAMQAGALAARLAGVPHVWHVREIWTSPRLITVPLYRFIHAFSDRVIALSQTAAEENFGRRAGDVQVIRDSIDPHRFQDQPALAELRQEFGLAPDTPVVGTVARLAPQKGLHCFLEAAERLASQRAGVRFMIVGDIPRPRYQAYKDQLLDMARRPALDGRVIFTGWRGDVPALLQLFTVFVLPSSGAEGLGSVIAEAWWARRPVVAPDHSGPKETVRHGHTGLHFRSGSAADLAAQVDMLLEDGALRERLAAAGHEEALAHYNAVRNVQKIEDVLHDALTHSRKGRKNS